MTIEWIAPVCVGCHRKRTQAVLRNFAKNNGHEFSVRETKYPVNMNYLKDLDLPDVDLGKSELIYIKETGAFIPLEGDNPPSDEQLEELLS